MLNVNSEFLERKRIEDMVVEITGVSLHESGHRKTIVGFVFIQAFIISHSGLCIYPSFIISHSEICTYSCFYT